MNLCVFLNCCQKSNLSVFFSINSALLRCLIEMFLLMNIKFSLKDSGISFLRWKWLSFFLILPFVINAQVEESDSTKTINSETKIRVAVGNKDSLERFQPLDSIEASKNVKVKPKKKKTKPAVAALCSMVVPGLGQAYNGKYWKIPIVYSTLGFMYFMSADSHRRYTEFKSAYKYWDNPNKRPSWVNENHEKDYMKKRMEYYKRQRDLNIIVGVIAYLLNILDANVDAHLMNFDVSEDLSLKIEPELNFLQANNFNQTNSTFGLKFVISLNR